MELRFPVQVQHSSITDANEGHFICDVEDSKIKSGVFRLSEYGDIDIDITMEEVQRIIETSHLTKGFRLGQRQVRFVCVLKRHGERMDDLENGDDVDDPYFCAVIDTNGWRLINEIWSRHHDK